MTWGSWNDWGGALVLWGLAAVLIPPTAWLWGRLLRDLGREIRGEGQGDHGSD